MWNSAEKTERGGCFSAEEFVDNLLNEASQISCDETLDDFNRNELPNFYNPNKFRRAQKFFEENVFALYFNKLLGLIVILASPSVLKILKMTNMSSSCMSSYRRYMSTLLHMNIWYENNLAPGSSAMDSIKKVKIMHNAASRKAKNLGMFPITQKDMVLTQFGFMGFAIARSEMMGIHGASKRDLECLVHFWRVIGYLMGIQDKYNLCRESLEETKEICDVLIDKVLRPSYEKKDKEFLEMTSYLVNGMWHMNPILNYRVFLTYLHEVLKTRRENNNEDKEAKSKDLYFALNRFEVLFLGFVTFVMFTLKYKIIRLYLNLQHQVSLWIMAHFPFLAIRSFGYNNSVVHVQIKPQVR